MSKPQSGVVNVRIYDREYALRTSGDVEHMEFLCEQLDKRMRDAADASGSVDTLRVAILAALTLTDDLFRLQDEFRKLDEVVGRRSMECVTMLDNFLH